MAPTFAALATAPWVYGQSGTNNFTAKKLFLDYAKTEYGLDGEDAQRPPSDPSGSVGLQAAITGLPIVWP